ncbi:MAG: lysophospholipid acyltransferase family protein [Bacteroidales bacterium]|nr:lysophospholipid acyltransferase family protein [Bacteroidales bacterium]
MESKRSFGIRLAEGFMHLLSRLPLGFHYACAPFLAWLVGDVFRYRRDVVTANLARSFPDADYDFLKETTKGFYRHFGEMMAETVWFGGRRGEKGRRQLVDGGICEIVNSDEFNAFFDRSSSVMLLNSHSGNWELMGGIAQYDRSAPGVRHWDWPEVVVIYRALENKFWDRVLGDNRCAPVSDRPFEGYVEGRSILRYAVSHRHEKKLYVFNTDQYPYYRIQHYDVGSFMNQPTDAMGGAAILACKLGMSVAYIRWFQEKPGHYRLTFVPLCENASETTPEQIMKLFYRHLEEDIKAQPSQYLWSHKRWRKTPL